MDTTSPSLVLGQPVHMDGVALYVIGMRVEPQYLGQKITYQVSQDMPGFYGWGRGPYPSITYWFDRDKLMDSTQFEIAELARIESEAYVYERTLTSIPIIELVGDATSYYILDGTTLFPFDGTNIDTTNTFDSTTIYIDPGFDFKDLEDSSGVFIAVIHDGTTYTIDSTNTDSTNFTLMPVTVTYHDGTNADVLVPTVDFSTFGRYTITYLVMDSQRITSYPAQRAIYVLPEPEIPVTC